MKPLIFFVVLVGTSIFPVFSQDTREKSLDFIVLIDKSLSMDDKIDSVKQFFNRELLDSQIKIGDSLLLINFYGKTEILLDQIVTTEDDNTNFKKVLKSIKADGPYTDIGTAIDTTSSYVKTHPRQGDRQHFILLTDGIQEAPPGSPYTGPKGYINHPFLENSKTISQSGWKIQILGIGSDTEAEALATELSGTVKVWAEPQTMLQDRTLNFLEDLRLSAPPSLVVNNGQLGLDLSVVASNLSKDQNFRVEKIKFISETGNEYILRSEEYHQYFDHNGEQSFIIPLNSEIFQTISTPKGDIVLSFSGSLPLSPGRFPVEVPAMENNSTWQYVLLVLVVFLLCFIIVMIVRNVRSRSEKEESIVSQEP